MTEWPKPIVGVDVNRAGDAVNSIREVLTIKNTTRYFGLILAGSSSRSRQTFSKNGKFIKHQQTSN